MTYGVPMLIRTTYEQLQPEDRITIASRQQRGAACPAAKLNVDSMAWGLVLTLLDWK